MCTIITSSRNTEWYVTSSHNTEWYVELWMLYECSVVICGLCVAIFGRREQLVLDLFPDVTLHLVSYLPIRRLLSCSHGHLLHEFTPGR